MANIAIHNISGPVVQWTDDSGGTVLTIDATDVTGDGTITDNYSAIIEVWVVSSGTDYDAGTSAAYVTGSFTRFSGTCALDAYCNDGSSWTHVYNEGTGITGITITEDGTDVDINCTTSHDGNHDVFAWAVIRVYKP